VRSQADGLSRAALLALPPTVPLYPDAADILGVGRSTAYEMVRTGEWPTRVLRLGRLIKVPTAELLEYVGVKPAGTGGEAA
jgi:excisionase family DNA binding protein